LKLNMEIPGIGRFDQRGTAQKVADKAGIEPTVLAAFRTGRLGLSLKNARKLAPVFESDKPVSLYVESQRRAIKTKIEAGERAAALRAAAVVLEELQKISPEELGAEGDELLDAVKALERIIADSLTGEPDEDDEAPEEDTGTKKPKAAKKSRRDPFGKKVGTEGSGGIRRDGYGKRLK
jgi:transcriptional regulator with XRE-family HTH domain